MASIEYATASAEADLRATIDNICARICHDLSGTLGTLSGALECVAEMADNEDDALRLASDAAGALMARLRLLRAAWSGPEGDLTPQDLSELLQGLSRRDRLRIDVSALRPHALPAVAARLLLNVLMLAAEALPVGGTITVRQAPADDAAGDFAIVTLISGVRAAWPAGLATCLADPADIAIQLAADRRLQAPLTALLARSSHLSLQFLFGAADQPPALLMSV
jgi:histidine phosphotransferase ChpT